MAVKREIRVIVASEDVAAIIDRGFEVDEQIKKLTTEDKGCKTKLTEVAKAQIGEDEVSVRLTGKVAAVVVSGAEKVELDVTAELFPKVRAAIASGLLSDIVERSVQLVVLPENVEKAAAVLNKAGIKATIAETLKVTAEKLRTATTTSVEAGLARADLAKCIKKETTYRVKFEKV
jgi:hypothetical protein